MKIDGIHHRSIAVVNDGQAVRIIDQRRLPWALCWVDLTSIDMAAEAIREMWTRGAPLIGATAAYGLAMALRADPSDVALATGYRQLMATRPTAINLKWALDQMMAAVMPLSPAQRADAAFKRAAEMCDEDVALNLAIGRHGLRLIEDCARGKPGGGVVNILTHCNAGWLATVDYGTALAPIYLAHDAGLSVHVWVDETRPRNQGALTAYELSAHGVPHTVITDNAGGLLMQRGDVDMCIVGTDRVTRNGDVCNKVGTYLKALAAREANIPFYVALPYTTFDQETETGDSVPIEYRHSDEVHFVEGLAGDGENGRSGHGRVRVTASPVLNPAFDITPAKLVSAYITERGVLKSPA